MIWGQSDGKIDGYKTGYAEGLNIFSKANKASEQDYQYQQSNAYYHKGYSNRFNEFYESGFQEAHAMGVKLFLYRVAVVVLLLAFVGAVVIWVRRKQKMKKEKINEPVWTFAEKS